MTIKKVVTITVEEYEYYTIRSALKTELEMERTRNPQTDSATFLKSSAVEKLERMIANFTDL